MKNCIYLLVLTLLSVIIFSCSDEDKMKRIVMNEAQKECPHYKFESFEILDTITVSDYKDSISSLEAKVLTNQMFLEDELKSIGELKAKQDDCRRERRRTLAWLKSTYDGLIADYDDLIERRQRRIDRYKEENIGYRIKKEELNVLISQKQEGDSIIYIVSSHRYDCGGGTIIENIFFDTDFKIIKKLYGDEK